MNINKLISVASTLHGSSCHLSSESPRPIGWPQEVSAYEIVFDDGVKWIAHVFHREKDAVQVIQDIRFMQGVIPALPTPRFHMVSYTSVEIGAPFILADSWTGSPLSEMWEIATKEERVRVLEQLAALTLEFAAIVAVPTDLPSYSRFRTAHGVFQHILDSRLKRALGADLKGILTPLDCLLQLGKLQEYVESSLNEHPFAYCYFAMYYNAIMVDSDYHITALAHWTDCRHVPLQWAASFPEFIEVDEDEEDRYMFLTAFRRLEAAKNRGPTPLADVMASDELRVFHASLTSRATFRDQWVPQYAQKNEITRLRAQKELDSFLTRHPDTVDLSEIRKLHNQLSIPW